MDAQPSNLPNATRPEWNVSRNGEIDHMRAIKRGIRDERLDGGARCGGRGPLNCGLSAATLAEQT
jgi:hypothetical protein